MSLFQYIVIGLFVAFIVVGVVVFALFGGVFGGSSIGTVVIWGTMDSQTFEYVLDALRSQDSSLADVSYVEKDPATYQSDLLNAMAAGTGPDLFLVSQDELGAFDDKVLVIPYSAMSQSTYLSSYIDEGQLFLTTQGELALPFSIDPMVMYWNRDLLAAAGVSSPPSQWDDLISLAPKLTTLSAQSVTQSAVALGTWDNITDAKAVLSTLFLQAGEDLTARAQDGSLVSVFGQTPSGAAESPAESALRFYTQFANPSKTTYTWNNALPQSQQAFVGGQLAIYFGFASEYPTIAQQNPNLRFSVAVMPQLSSGSNSTFGNLTGLAIPRTALNPSGAMAVAEILAGQEASGILASQTGMPSARRDVPLDTSANASAQIFSQSALVAAGWVDPDPTQTDDLFKAMIESVLSGGNDPAQAVSEAAQGMSQLLPYNPSSQ